MTLLWFFFINFAHEKLKTENGKLDNCLPNESHKP